MRALAILVVLVGCGDDGGTNSTPPDASFPFTPPPMFAPCSGTLGFPGVAGIVTADHATNVTVADLDGDGIADVVALDGNVAIAHGLGGGALDALAHQTVPTTSALAGLAVGDVDGDGHPDIATTTTLPGNTPAIAVLFNKGDGTFTAPETFATAHPGTAIAIADVDGDTKADFVISDDSGTASALLGGETFATQHDIIGGFGFVAVVDVTGDDKPDLVTPTTVLANTGGGTFATPAVLPGNVGATTAVVAAFTPSGHPDIVVASATRAALMVNDGTGSFTEVDLPGHAAQLAAGDVDGDGAIDLVGADGGAAVYHNHGDGTFDAPVQLPAAPNADGLALADLDGDGKLDIATAGDNVIDVLHGDGQGSFDARAQLTAATAPLGKPTALIGDVTGDGMPDVVYTDLAGIRVLPSTGSRTFGTAIVTPLPMLTHALLADVDGDGRLDVVAGVAGNIAVAYGGGDGTFVTQTYPLGFDPDHVAVGDVDHDGQLDLAANAAHDVVTVLLDTGGRTFATGIPLQVPESFDEIAISSGVILLSDLSNSTLQVASYLSASNTLGVISAFNGRGLGLGLADVDHDGTPDLLTRAVDVVLEFHGHGDRTFDVGELHSLPGPLATASLADVDGDGEVDLAIVDVHDIAIARGHGKSFDLRAPFAFDIAQDAAIAVGDLDGDGHADFVVPEGDGGIIGIRFGSCR